MKGTQRTPPNNPTAALEAINNLTARDLAECFDSGQVDAMMAHDAIGLASINLKSGIFYRHLVPCRKNLVSALATSYRRYLKLALAHQREIESAADQWAWQAVQPAIITTLDWLRDWYILACDGENQYVQKAASVPFVPGGKVSISIPLAAPPFPAAKSWRAPAWLFQVSPTLGILLLRSEHVPANDSEEKLSAAHTRLLLRAARRSFLWQFDAAIDVVRNEEIAAAGAIPAPTRDAPQTGEPKKPKHWLKGVEGLVRKADLSRYMQGLTEKQKLAASLKWEYGLGLAEIASRMGVNRKTAHEHIDAAKRKMEEVLSSEKRRATHAKSEPNF